MVCENGAGQRSERGNTCGVREFKSFHGSGTALTKFAQMRRTSSVSLCVHLWLFAEWEPVSCRYKDSNGLCFIAPTPRIKPPSNARQLKNKQAVLSFIL